MKHFKSLLFSLLLAGIIMFSACGGGSSNEAKKLGEFTCQMMELSKKMQEAADDAEREELQKKVEELNKDSEEFMKAIEEKYKEDKAGQEKVLIEMYQYLIDNCDAMSEQDKEMYQKEIDKVKGGE